MLTGKEKDSVLGVVFVGSEDRRTSMVKRGGNIDDNSENGTSGEPRGGNE